MSTYLPTYVPTHNRSHEELDLNLTEEEKKKRNMTRIRANENLKRRQMDELEGIGTNTGGSSSGSSNLVTMNIPGNKISMIIVVY